MCVCVCLFACFVCLCFSFFLSSFLPFILSFFLPSFLSFFLSFFLPSFLFLFVYLFVRSFVCLFLFLAWLFVGGRQGDGGSREQSKRVIICLVMLRVVLKEILLLFAIEIDEKESGTQHIPRMITRNAISLCIVYILTAFSRKL